MLRRALQSKQSLPPEQEEGSTIEYKLKLHELDPLMTNTLVRFQHYASQLAWRLSDTNECIYILGVNDSGLIKGITRLDLDRSLQVLEQMCHRVKAVIGHIDRINLKDFDGPIDKWVCEVTIVKKVGSRPKRRIERRTIAVIGPSQIGKSTLIGTLCSGHLDNPSGSNRLRLLRHRHEIISGKTTCTSVDYLTLPCKLSAKVVDDKIIRDGSSGSSSSEDLFEEFNRLEVLGSKSHKNHHRIIQFFDLPGDPKYLKTAYSCLTLPNFDAVLMIHPLPSDDIDHTYLHELRELLDRLQIKVIEVGRDEFDCITGHGMDKIINRLTLELFPSTLEKIQEGSDSIFQVEHVYNGPDIGLIISGVLLSGTLQCGQQLFYLSSSSQNISKSVTIRSLHSMRQAIEVAACQQPIAFTISSGESFEGKMSLLKGTMFSSNPQYFDSLKYTTEFKITNGNVKRSCQLVEDKREGLLFLMGNRLPATFFVGSTSDDYEYMIRLHQGGIWIHLCKRHRFIFLSDNLIIGDVITL